MHAKRVHPKRRRIHRVAYCNVACYALGKPELCEYAEGECKSVLEVCAFFVGGVEGGWCGSFVLDEG